MMPRMAVINMQTRLFQIYKLGFVINNEAAFNLKKLTTTLDIKTIGPPKSLNIIVGTGVSHTRPDGINIISLASLGV